MWTYKNLSQNYKFGKWDYNVLHFTWRLKFVFIFFYSIGKQNHYLWSDFRRTGMSQKCLLVSSCLSTCISVALVGWIFVKHDIGDFYKNLSWNSTSCYDWTKISGTLCENLSLFHIVGSNILQQWTEHIAVIPVHSLQYLLLGIGL